MVVARALDSSYAPLIMRPFAPSDSLPCLFALTLLLGGTAELQAVEPPSGFTALFNGTDLGGWRGGDTFDHRKYLALPEDKRAAQDAAWTADMKKHWSVEDGVLVNDGHGKYATTVKDYGDFELLVEYKTVAGADSGIYLRGVPQVQIWDRDKNPEGSGGLWNNSPGAPGKKPLVVADRPFGEWNKFRIIMVGSRVSVWFNGKQVVDHANMENYYDRSKPVPARGPIQLQTHGGEIRWRNVFIREIGSEEANRLLAWRGKEGFKPIFSGKAGGLGRPGRQLRGQGRRPGVQTRQGRDHLLQRGIRRLRGAHGVQASARRKQRARDSLSRPG